MMHVRHRDPDIVVAVDDVSASDVSASIVGVSLAAGWIEDVPVEEIAVSGVEGVTANRPGAVNSVAVLRMDSSWRR